MELVRLPAPGLRDLVVKMVGYDHVVDPAAVHWGVPRPSTTVIISFDQPLDLQWHRDPTTRGQWWLMASGMHTTPALIHTHGSQHGIQLDLTPLGCRVLLGVPMGSLSHAMVDQADLPLGISAVLREQLSQATWAQRFTLLERQLLRLAARSRARVPDDLDHAWQLLQHHRGRIRVTELAAEVGWSRRHLVTRFTTEFGVPPRDLIRLHRLATARELAGTGARWAAIAARAGYADQAHLSREFRSLAGQTPSQWRAESFPILQDSPADSEHS